MTVPKLVDPSGRPLVRASAAMSAHDAAALDSQELGNWWPMTGSADRMVLAESRTITDRARDWARNDGIAAGAVTTARDWIIGHNIRPDPLPDARALGITQDQAFELADQMATQWVLATSDPRRLIDASRHDTWGGLSGLMFNHRYVDGEAVGVILWRPRGGDYATCLQVVDPDRVSNPDGESDGPRLRKGIRYDGDGAMTGAHIRKSHPHDVGLVDAEAWSWDFIPRETPWGRPMLIHDYDKSRAEQSRGVSKFAPVMRTGKMLDKQFAAEQQIALLNATLGAVAESPFDHEFLMEILGDTGGEKSFQRYQGLRKEFHDKRQVSIGGVRIPIMFPGERINFMTATRPSSGLGPFAVKMMEKVAAALPGHTYATLTQDYSRSNYSSERSNLLSSARSVLAERFSFAVRTGTPLYHAVMEEAFMAGRITPPAGAPDFHDAVAAYLRAEWVGPADGWIDPLKEAQAALARMEGGLSTLRDECARQGTDYRQVITQRARERRMWAENGLPDPNLPAIMSAGGGQAYPSDPPPEPPKGP
ncbi:MAG: phage portal protein [Alphaproteobacteria bacterium]|nr:phage portal protein [Alphaproteobacteria bacterium]